MSYQYVKIVDEETLEVQIVGRFQHGLPEIYKNGEWKSESYMYSWQMDGLLDKISEVEAKKLIAEMKSKQLQVA